MSTVSFPQVHPLGDRHAPSIALAVVAPVRRVFTQKVWPALRTIPGYLIMTPYSATILLLVAISIGLGLEEPFFPE